MQPQLLPQKLSLAAKQDKAIEIARTLDGLAVSDAIEILESVRWFLTSATIATTALLPPRCDGFQIEPSAGGAVAESA